MHLGARVVAVLVAIGAAGCAGDGAIGGGGADGAGPGGPDGGGGPGGDPSAELYAQDRLPRFDVELSDESRAALRADGTQYVTCTFRYGDETLTGVGIKIKGEYNRKPFDEKAAFKLKFDEFAPDQRFRGLVRLTLNGALEDPSFVAERLIYLAYREAGVAAPRANNALLYIDGVYRGVYVNVETEDKTFLARWFAINDGNLYEEGGQDWFPGNEASFELETNEAVNDRSGLTALFAAADGAAPESLLVDVAGVLDVEAWLRQAALEGLVSQWDGYAYTQFGPNNYRLYDDPTTGFHVLPWGMDMALKPYDGRDVIGLDQPGGALFARCLEGAACRARFVEIVDEELARWTTIDLAGQARTMQAQIRDAVATDTYTGVPVEAFDGWVDVVVDQIANRAQTAGDDL